MKSTMRCTYTVLFFCVIFAHIRNAKPSLLTGEEKLSLQNFVETLIQCRDNVGMIVAMVKNGQIVHTEGFGYRDLYNEQPMTNTTKINIGSQTKSFTAALAALSVSKGYAGWDTPLVDILGEEFQLQDQFRTELASFRDVLAHKLAMPSYWGASTAALNFSREELVMSRFQHFTEIYEFRERWKYANYPFVLAGYVTEILSGLTWEDEATLLFELLGMNETRHAASLLESDWSENTAYSYINVDGEYTQNDEIGQLPFLMEISPAGGIFSTANDMAEYLLFHLSGGKNSAGDQIVPEEALSELYKSSNAVTSSYTIRPPVYPVEDSVFTYGLGWYLGTYKGRDKLYHTGSYSSYNCKMTLLPEEEIGVWACVNSPGDGRGSTAVQLANLYMLDLLLGDEPWLNETTACTFPSPWQPTSTFHKDQIDMSWYHEMDLKVMTQHEKRPSESYIGQYEHPGFGILTVLPDKDNDANLRMEFGLLLNGLLNTSYVTDKFYLIPDPPLDYRLAFYPEFPNGYPTYFVTQPGSTSADAIYVPYLEFELPPLFIKITGNIDVKADA